MVSEHGLGLKCIIIIKNLKYFVINSYKRLKPRILSLLLLYLLKSKMVDNFCLKIAKPYC